MVKFAVLVAGSAIILGVSWRFLRPTLAWLLPLLGLGIYSAPDPAQPGLLVHRCAPFSLHLCVVAAIPRTVPGDAQVPFAARDKETDLVS